MQATFGLFGILMKPEAAFIYMEMSFDEFAEDCVTNAIRAARGVCSLGIPRLSVVGYVGNLAHGVSSNGFVETNSSHNVSAAAAGWPASENEPPIS